MSTGRLGLSSSALNGHAQVDFRPARSRAEVRDWRIRAVADAPPTFTGDVAGFAESDRFQLLLDGRLHEAEALRHLLGVPTAQSQAHLLLRAYEVWGRRLLSRLSGEFVLIVADRQRNTLFAARDRVGSVPLYYRRSGRTIEVARSIEAFGSALALDRAALGHTLAGRVLPSELTPYQGTRRLPPGHCLSFSGGDLSLERYWRPPVPSKPGDWLREEDLPAFDQLFERAVLRALGDGRSAVFLSGGIDSVSVAATAVDAAMKHGRPAPLALSLRYPGEVDEPPLQRAVAERLGIEHMTLELRDAVGEQGLLLDCLEASARGPLPLQNPWRPATDSLAGLARDSGCEAILTGSGGDEWLTVDAVATADYLRSGDLVGLIRFLGSLRRSLQIPTAELLTGYLWRAGVQPLLPKRLRRVGRAAAGAGRSGPEWLRPLPALPAKPVLATGSYAGAVEALPLHPLRVLEVDEKAVAARESGLRQTDVYWDVDLVEFLCRVPPHLLYRGGRTKGLVRQRLAERFPGLGFERQKKVVRRNLLVEIVLREGNAAWRHLGDAAALVQLDLVEPRKLEEFVRRTLATGDRSSVDALWRIYSLESWARPRV